jgi:hypothetical protein
VCVCVCLPIVRHFSCVRSDVGVRRCEKSECRTTWWNRDVNAARKIGILFMRRQKRVAFCRKNSHEIEEDIPCSPPLQEVWPVTSDPLVNVVSLFLESVS